MTLDPRPDYLRPSRPPEPPSFLHYILLAIIVFVAAVYLATVAKQTMINKIYGTNYTKMDILLDYYGPKKP
jgi:hypothetical protein